MADGPCQDYSAVLADGYIINDSLPKERFWCGIGGLLAGCISRILIRADHSVTQDNISSKADVRRLINFIAQNRLKYYGSLANR